MGLDYYYSVMPTMAWLVAALLSDHDEAYTIFLLCDVAEPPARATVTKSSQDLIRSDHVILDITARWLCLNPSRAFSNFCGGRDLATFPALAEYKEREKLRTEKRERERDRAERERETGDAHLEPDPESVHTAAGTAHTPNALFDKTMSVLRKSQLLIIKNLWLLHMLNNIFRTF